MANRALPNFGHDYHNIVMPVTVSCNFIVDSTNGNGLGIRSLKSNGYVKNVFMHTSSTPAAANPNPNSGYILIQLADNYNKSVSGMKSLVSPVTGSNLATTLSAASLTVGNPYVITVLGNATVAQWQALGVPAGITPAVGVPFIAKVVGVGTQTSMVKAVGNSGIVAIETIGNTNLMLGPQGVQNQGGWIMLQALASTSSSVTTLIPTAPANETVIALSFLLDNSSVTVDGL